jgi:hypothetical protein
METACDEALGGRVHAEPGPPLVPGPFQHRYKRGLLCVFRLIRQGQPLAYGAPAPCRTSRRASPAAINASSPAAGQLDRWAQSVVCQGFGADHLGAGGLLPLSCKGF